MEQVCCACLKSEAIIHHTHLFALPAKQNRQSFSVRKVTLVLRTTYYPLIHFIIRQFLHSSYLHHQCRSIVCPAGLDSTNHGWLDPPFFASFHLETKAPPALQVYSPIQSIRFTTVEHARYIKIPPRKIFLAEFLSPTANAKIYACAYGKIRRRH